MHVNLKKKTSKKYIAVLNGKYCECLVECGVLKPFWKLYSWACCLSSQNELCLRRGVYGA
jgi:hypothetical protein